MMDLLELKSQIDRASRQLQAAVDSQDEKGIETATETLWRLAGHEYIIRDKELFESGDNAALLHAVMVSFRHEIEPPEWVKQSFIASYDRVLSLMVGSWDEAFGRAIPKGKHLQKLRQRRKLRPLAYRLVTEILENEPETPIDDGLFERVGAELNIGKTLAAELYYEVKKILPRNP